MLAESEGTNVYSYGGTQLFLSQPLWVSCQPGDPVLFILTSLQPCSHLPISLPGSLLLTLYIAFSPVHPPLLWKLGGRRPRVSGVIECDGVVCVFAHAFILNPFPM